MHALRQSRHEFTDSMRKLFHIFSAQRGQDVRGPMPRGREIKKQPRTLVASVDPVMIVKAHFNNTESRVSSLIGIRFTNATFVNQWIKENIRLKHCRAQSDRSIPPTFCLQDLHCSVCIRKILSQNCCSLFRLLISSAVGEMR